MTISSLTAPERHHPAKFSSPVLEVVKTLLDEWGVSGPILDPYAGVGWLHRISTIDRPVFAGELEHAWAHNDGVHYDRTVQSDAGCLPFADGTFAAVGTSAIYPNRVRDHHNARDKSKRKTYEHLHRELTGESLRPTNLGAMNNIAYRRYSQAHIREFARVVRDGGLLLLNMSNSIEDHTENNAVEQWLNWLTLARCWVREVRPVGTRRMGYGANRDARADHEVVIVAEFPPKADQGTLV